MRLFCGIEIPAGIKAGLEAITNQLKPLAKLSWSPTENLHVTTKFIGEWPEERLGEMTGALADVPKPGPVEIAIRGLGWFPDARHPRVLFGKVVADEALPKLARDTEACVVSAGGPVEAREYRPHLTLARVSARQRNPDPAEGLEQAVAELATREFGSFRAEAFFLYLSKSGRYVKLTEFPLS